MNPEIPFYIALIIIAIVSALFILFFLGFNYVLARSDFPARKRIWTITYSSLLLMTWLIVLEFLAYNDFFLKDDVMLKLSVVLLIPLLFSMLFLFSKKAGAMVMELPPSFPVNVQVFRVFIEMLYLILFFRHMLPEEMTILGRNFDIIVGVTAPLVSFLCFNKKFFSKRIAILWNIGGLILILNFIVTSAVYLSGSGGDNIAVNANLFGYFPYIWIPGFLIPFSVLMHFVSLKQLFKAKIII